MVKNRRFYRKIVAKVHPLIMRCTNLRPNFSIDFYDKPNFSVPSWIVGFSNKHVADFV